MKDEWKQGALWVAAVTAAISAAGPALAQEHAEADEPFCPASQGTYKNSDAWPASNMSLGSHEYDERSLRAILDAPTRGDKSIALARQLIAAELNAAAGHATNVTTADGNTTVDEAIRAAHALIGDQQVPAKVKGKADAQWGELTAVLDAFNNGAFTDGCFEADEEEQAAEEEADEPATEEETVAVRQ